MTHQGYIEHFWLAIVLSAKYRLKGDNREGAKIDTNRSSVIGFEGVLKVKVSSNADLRPEE